MGTENNLERVVESIIVPDIFFGNIAKLLTAKPEQETVVNNFP